MLKRMGFPDSFDGNEQKGVLVSDAIFPCCELVLSQLAQKLAQETRIQRCSLKSPFESLHRGCTAVQDINHVTARNVRCYQADHTAMQSAMIMQQCNFRAIDDCNVHITFTAYTNFNDIRPG